YVCRLTGRAVVQRDVGALASENEIRILRIARRHAVLLNVHRMPVVERDLTVHRPAVHAGGAGILLPAAYTIRERVIRRHVIHRGSRLIVPVAPRHAAIARNDRALVRDYEQNVRIVRVYPCLLIIITARRTAHRAPRDTAIFSAPEHRRCTVDDVRIFWIYCDRRKVTATDTHEWTRIQHRIRRCPWIVRISRCECPVLACIGRLVETNRSSRSTASWCCGPGCACHHRIDGTRRAHRDTEIRFDYPYRKSIRELLPRGAAIRRLEDSALRAAELRAFDVTLLLLPERSVNDVRILWIDANVVAAHVLILVKHLLESLAAISRAEYSALRIRTVGMAKRSDEEPIRICGIDLD